MEPLVSVIIATYNRAGYVTQAVQSVLSQTYGNIEIIVVDDGSSDNTREVLEKYQPEVDYIYQQRSERSKARNRGFKHSSGTYIAFLDSDDLWFPTKIERQVELLNAQPDVGLVYTDVQFIDLNGNPYAGQICWDLPKRKVLYEDLMTNNVITGTTSSAMMRRQCLEQVGLFDESMNACEDLDLFRRIAGCYKFRKIHLPLVKFRIHPRNTQQNATAMAKGWERTISKILEDTLPEFQYYRYEAILKLLFEIAKLYWQDHGLHRFFSFCAKSVFHRPNWVLKYGFWRDFLRFSFKRIHNYHESCIGNKRL